MIAALDSHLLSLLVWLPAAAGMFAMFLPRQNPRLLRGYGIGAGAFVFLVSLALLVGSEGAVSYRFVENVEWIPQIGVRYHLAVDGFSLWLILLTTFLTPLTLWVSYGSVRVRVKEFIAAFLILESAMIGAFVSLDLFLFYVFWELMLVPMYIIIGVFGGPNRVYAALKFFIYTFAASVFMLVAIIYMVVRFHALDEAHRWTFDYFDLMRLAFPSGVEQLLFVAFAIAFAVKVPMFPLHTWLPDAHTEAPTGGSMILAAVMLKLGTYGFLRFAMPLFPTASQHFGLVLAGLSCAGILYGAAVAWRQRDFKKLIAYSSVSHLGFVMLGLAARTPQSITGAVLQMVNHGLSTGALFLLVGVIYDRRHTRDLGEFGGLATVMPGYAACFVLVTMSSIGLPLTNGFVGEFLIITGTFSSSLLTYQYHTLRVEPEQAMFGPLYGSLAALGVLFGAIYMLYCVQRVFFGPLTNPKNKHLADLDSREWIGLVPLMGLILFIGVYPMPFTSRIEPVAQRWVAEYAQKRIAIEQHGHADDQPFLLPGPDGDVAAVQPAAAETAR